MDYAIHLLIFFEAYFLAALGLNVLLGYSGLLSLAHAGYFALGSYGYALAATRLGSSIWISLSVAVLVPVFLSGLLWVLSLRLNDDAWALGSLAVQCLIFAVLNNWTDGSSPVGGMLNLTNGPYGISGYGRPSLVGFAASSPLSVAVMCTAFTAACSALYWLMIESPWSRLLRAVRDDELATRALGKNIPSLKFQVLAFGCGLAAAGGAINAAYVGYVHPNIAMLDNSILMFCMVIVGGVGTVFRGPLIGTLVLLLVPEVLRLGNVSQNKAGSIRLLLYGITLVVLMHRRSQGLAGKQDLR